ncbi:FmdB family zinc ribbon protein [Mesorhizobium liriopis]|uniref:FmdB family zinc ribbon protein n=1 Tax=Mesorhizobium liriopis TaxID=2953882 RepID=UPI00338DEA9B
MPNYDYSCSACGPFTAMQPMAAFKNPCACPECGAGASRMFLSAPAIAGIGASGSSILASHERDASSRGPAKAAHPAGCGCCMRRSPIPSTLSSTDRVFSSNGPLPRSGR